MFRKLSRGKHVPVVPSIHVVCHHVEFGCIEPATNFSEVGKTAL
jgi:hypothetical protein